ncbi:plasmid maintenance system antidote protein VapI [Dyadobacter arcticus]|uniref:Plasmid maintenance system antidote protein VapI n=2 Tax=Dyadobacter arcticus TaxID=1078754 RepID=A0ABX0UMY7_9BACT|nr:plasmid maintenance system antidote protein VapI [Dyadobacter arcticus]
MSQKDLAEKLQVTPQTVNSWVKGNSNFTIETIVRIEEALGVELIGVRVG